MNKDKKRQSLVDGALATRCLVSIMNMYSVTVNGIAMTSKNELTVYLIGSTIASGLLSIIFSYVNEVLKNRINNYDIDKQQQQVKRPVIKIDFSQARLAQDEEESIRKEESKKLNSWIPFLYSM